MWWMRGSRLLHREHLTVLGRTTRPGLPTHRGARCAVLAGEHVGEHLLEHSIRRVHLVNHRPHKLQRHDVSRRTLARKQISLLLDGVDLHQIFRDRGRTSSGCEQLTISTSFLITSSFMKTA